MGRVKHSLYLTVLISLSSISICFAQVSISPHNVVNLDSTLNCSRQLADSLLNYKFIMVGEMHGTEEPVRCVQSIALQLSKTKTVKVGFEIPADNMKKSARLMSDSRLRSSSFFRANDYGMASQAWFDAILRLANEPNVSVFFFDWTETQRKFLDRDSSMFLNMRQEYLMDTTCVIISISGNIHNQIHPYKNSKTMGYFVSTYLTHSVLSLNHLYESGTMYNNGEAGVELKKVESDKTTLKSISKTANYFYFDLHHEFSKQWNAFLFTTKINASYPIKNK